ncbi:MAG: helix-turn-helix domain-containing protein [Prevotella sp.]
MKKILYIIVVVFLASCGNKASRTSDSSRTNDSIYTIEYIKHICVSQPERALALLDTIEERKLLKMTDVNGLRAVIYQNGLGQTNVALKYAKRLYDSPELREDTVVAIKTLQMITVLSNQNSHYADALKYANEGIAIANAAGDKVSEASILQLAGSSLASLGRIEEAISYIDRGTQILTSIDNGKDFGIKMDIYYGQMQKLNVYLGVKQFDKLIETMASVRNAYETLSKCDNLPEGYLDKFTRDLHYCSICCYTEMGMRKEAAESYEQLMKLPPSPATSEMVVPYLIMIQQYDKAMQGIKEAKQRFIANRDTIHYNYMENCLGQEMKILKGMGKYREALGVAEQMMAINDSIARREKAQQAQEMATIYETADKELQIAHLDDRLQSGKTVLTLAIMLLMIAIIVIVVVIRYNRIIKLKNRAAVATIDELMAARERLDEVREQADSRENENTETKSQEEPSEICRLKREIEEKRLYLDPLFDRNRAAEMLSEQNVRTFSAEFNQAFGTSFPRYLSSLRLDHSLSLLCSDEMMNVETIAANSGFATRQTFYRTFMERFGITPSEYRKMKGLGISSDSHH